MIINCLIYDLLCFIVAFFLSLRLEPRYLHSFPTRRSSDVSFSLLPFWSSYEGFLFYHLTMGIALSMISGGDVALIWDSYLADGGEKSRGAAVLGNATFASQMGTRTSAVLGGAVVLLSYGHLLWANAILSWIPVLLVLAITEPPVSYERPKKWAQNLKDVLSATVVRDATARLVLLNVIIWGSGA